MEDYRISLEHIHWFEWSDKANQLLLDEAQKADKIGLESWDIRDIIENASLESIDKWITNCDDETYQRFLQEIGESDLRIKTRIKLCKVKLFKFSDSNFYSFSEVTGYDIKANLCLNAFSCFIHLYEYSSSPLLPNCRTEQNRADRDLETELSDLVRPVISRFLLFDCRRPPGDGRTA